MSLRSKVMKAAELTGAARTLVRGRARSHEPKAIAADIDGLGRERRDALRARMQSLIHTLGGTQPGPKDTESLVVALAAALEPVDEDTMWLLLAVMEARLPTVPRVLAAARAARLSGTSAAIRLSLWNGPARRLLDRGPWRQVKIVTGAVLVDVHHTSQTDFATGIQRVTRETTRRWAAEHPVTMVGWTEHLQALRALTPIESRRAFWGGPAVPVPTEDAIVVPWQSIFLLPELSAEVARTSRQMALARFGRVHYGAIGYDLVPVTSAETSHSGMLPGFASNLAALRHADIIVPISEAAGNEYRGWRAMLAGIDLPGPSIVPVVLPSQAPPADNRALAAAADRLKLGELPMVLVVGSHEPRKNHTAVLHAAEVLWREGHRFSLTFIGGNSWNSERFQAHLAKLQLAGRPVESISAADDDLLWSAFRLARFTVFPSVNEGFGLPVAESLAAGTPAITSAFGSMQEIAAAGGALLVDPRDDESVTDGMRRLVTDDVLLDELRAQAAARVPGSWDDYAGRTWRILTTGRDEHTS